MRLKQVRFASCIFTLSQPLHITLTTLLMFIWVQEAITPQSQKWKSKNFYVWNNRKKNNLLPVRYFQQVFNIFMYLIWYKWLLGFIKLRLPKWIKYCRIQLLFEERYNRWYSFSTMLCISIEVFTNTIRVKPRVKNNMPFFYHRVTKNNNNNENNFKSDWFYLVKTHFVHSLRGKAYS